jgi:hypothetical protein
MKPTLVITAVVAALLVLGLALGVGAASSSSPSSSSSSDSYATSDDGETGSSRLSVHPLAALSIVSGVLAIAAVFVPTMPRSRQVMLAGVGLVAAGYGIYVWDQDVGSYTFPSLVTIAPVLIVGWAAHGWYQNVQRGEGARGSVHDTDDTGPELVFPVAVRAASRGSVGLDLEVEADPAVIRDAVARTLANRGNYFTTDGCAYSVVAHRPDGLDCAIVSGVRARQMCTFAVRLVVRDPHRLTVRLQEFRTETEKLFLVVPMGPATIPGYGSYRHFLRALPREVRRIDRGAMARVVQG